MGDSPTLRNPSIFLTQELPLSSNNLSLIFQRWEDLYEKLESPLEVRNHDAGLSWREEVQKTPEINQDTEDVQPEPSSESSSTINGTENPPADPAPIEEGGDQWDCDDPSELSSFAWRRLIQECWGNGGGTQMETETVPDMATRRETTATIAIHIFPDNGESTEPLSQPFQPATSPISIRPSTSPIRVFQHYTWQLEWYFGWRAHAPDMLLLRDHLVNIDEKNSRKMRERDQWLLEMENMVDTLFGD